MAIKEIQSDSGSLWQEKQLTGAGKSHRDLVDPVQRGLDCVLERVWNRGFSKHWEAFSGPVRLHFRKNTVCRKGMEGLSGGPRK